MASPDESNRVAVWPPPPHIVDGCHSVIEIDGDSTKIKKNLRLFSFMAGMFLVDFWLIFFGRIKDAIVAIVHQRSLFPLPYHFGWTVFNAIIFPLDILLFGTMALWLWRLRHQQPAFSLDSRGITTSSRLIRAPLTIPWDSIQSVTIGWRNNPSAVILRLKRWPPAFGFWMLLSRRRMHVSRNYLDCTQTDWEFKVVPEIVERVEEANAAGVITTPAHPSA